MPYTVGGKGRSAATQIARLVRLGLGGGEEVAVAYEQHGTTATQVEHVALELGTAKAGQQTLKVSVSDLNSGDTVEEEAAFVIKTSPESKR